MDPRSQLGRDSNDDPTGLDTARVSADDYFAPVLIDFPHRRAIPDTVAQPLGQSVRDLLGALLEPPGQRTRLELLEATRGGNVEEQMQKRQVTWFDREVPDDRGVQGELRPVGREVLLDPGICGLGVPLLGPWRLPRGVRGHGSRQRVDLGQHPQQFLIVCLGDREIQPRWVVGRIHQTLATEDQKVLAVLEGRKRLNAHFPSQLQDAGLARPDPLASVVDPTAPGNPLGPRPSADPLAGLQHHDRAALLVQSPSRRQSGISATDNNNIN